MDQAPYPYETGVIHGRFQVLHNDHLKYLLSGKALCRHLVVGITNPEPLLARMEEQVDPSMPTRLLTSCTATDGISGSAFPAVRRSVMHAAARATGTCPKPSPAAWG